MGSPEAGAEARRYGRSATLLATGIGIGGILTYLYFALASHNLSRVDYGQIVVLWSLVIVTVSIVDRPVEQLLSRTIAERQERRQPIGRPLRVAALIQLGIALTVAACSSPSASRSRTTCPTARRRSTGSSWSPSSATGELLRARVPRGNEALPPARGLIMNESRALPLRARRRGGNRERPDGDRHRRRRPPLPA